MARITLALAAALAAATLLALAAAPASAVDAPASPAPTKCPWGCATCEPYTPEELAAMKAAREARKAARAEAKAAGEALDNAASGRRLAAADAADGEDAEDDAPAAGEWGAGRRGPGARSGNWTKSKCLTCKDATYTLKKGRCVCVPGYGVPLPDPATFTPGQRPRGPPPACAKCPAGTASGPDAPKPDWAALKAKWQAARAAAGKPPAAGGRRLLAASGAAGKHGKGKGVCVPCPGGKSNDARTACL